MPLKIAGNEISTMDELIVAMSVPSVVLDSAIHLYRGWSTGSTRTPFTAREVAQPVKGRQGRRDGRPVGGRQGGQQRGQPLGPRRPAPAHGTPAGRRDADDDDPPVVRMAGAPGQAVALQARHELGHG